MSDAQEVEDTLTAHALRVVARGLIADAVSEYVTDIRPHDIPGLDPYDYDDVTNIAVELTIPPDDAEYTAAMEHLAKRGQR